MTTLTLKNLTKTYDTTTIVKSVSLEIAQGQLVSLLGPSGCGKTTILRMIAGLLEPSGGQILFGDEDVTHLPANRRNVGLVFQSYALFPHMTVFENVAFGLRRQGVKGEQLTRRVNEALGQVRLGALADRFPRQLSGGQQQRVALARSIAPRPAILLFDEPLSNLDAQLREEMQIEIKRLQSDLGLTALFVTHDQHEAMTLSDRICLMSGGTIQQFDTPERVYFAPANSFVSGFVGSPNKLTGTVADGMVEIAPGFRLASSHIPHGLSGPCRVTLRQEDVILATSTGGQSGRITMRIFEGATVQYLINIGGSREIMVRVPSRGPQADYPAGTDVALSIPADRVFVASDEAAS